jgi:hypothetical protein
VALRRWRWLWGPMLAALGLAVMLLPPRQPSYRGLLAAFGLAEPEWVGERRSPFENDVRAAVSRLQKQVRDGRLADSLVAAARGVRALRSANGFVTVVYETPLTADSARVWLRAASSELSLYPSAGGPGLPVVVALISSPARLRSKDILNRLYWTFEELVDVAPSRGACVVTINLLDRKYSQASDLVGHDSSGGPSGRFVDLCALYARFGRPGPAGVWLGAARRPYWFGRSLLASRLQEARRAIRRAETNWDESAARPPWAGGVPWLEIGCLHGASSLCAHIAGLAGPSEPRFYYYYLQPFSRTQIVAHLLATGTPAQFAAFWRSPAPPAQSLQVAYGRPAGETVRSAYGHWYADAPPGGPRAGTDVVLAGFLWAGLALMLAVAVGRSWKTEI